MNTREALDQLRTGMARLRSDNNVPALAAVMVNYRDGNRIVVEHAEGLRNANFDATDPDNIVQSDDVFAVGSISKPMTGYLITHLIQNGHLTWNTKVRDIFREFDEVAGFRARYGSRDIHLDATVADLLSHSSLMEGGPEKGMDRLMSWAFPNTLAPSVPPENVDEYATHASLAYRRYNYVVAAVRDAPVKRPKYGGGCIITAAMAERLDGRRPFEEIIHKDIFQPLGMERAGFGRTSTGEKPFDGIWQHTEGPTGPVAQREVTEVKYDYHSHAPAGTGYLNTHDMARFMAANFPESGEAKVLVRDDMLVEAQTPHGTTHTRGGWFQGPANQERLIWHNGINTLCYAEMYIWPESSVGVAAAANMPGPGATAVSALRVWMSSVVRGLEM